MRLYQFVTIIKYENGHKKHQTSHSSEDNDKIL